MTTTRTIMATTRVDRHGDRFTREALENAADQVKSAFLPVLFNHDPRHPPLGRTLEAHLVQLDDDEWALVAESEIFDPSTPLPPVSSEREMSLHAFPENRITIISDRSYRSQEDRALIEELSSRLSAHAEVMEKKALEPLSVLLIGMSAAATAFMAGFLNKMGGDAWNCLKESAKKLLANRRADQSEYLFIFEIQVRRASALLSVQCILTNPDTGEIEEFWSKGLARLEALLPLFMNSPEEIRRVVVSYKNGEFKGLFAVRSDCVGLHIELPDLRATANLNPEADE
jgi:hypothetical protein